MSTCCVHFRAKLIISRTPINQAPFLPPSVRFRKKEEERSTSKSPTAGISVPIIVRFKNHGTRAESKTTAPHTKFADMKAKGLTYLFRREIIFPEGVNIRQTIFSILRSKKNNYLQMFGHICNSMLDLHSSQPSGFAGWGPKVKSKDLCWGR